MKQARLRSGCRASIIYRAETNRAGGETRTGCGGGSVLIDRPPSAPVSVFESVTECALVNGPARGRGERMADLAPEHRASRVVHCDRCAGFVRRGAYLRRLLPKGLRVACGIREFS